MNCIPPQLPFSPPNLISLNSSFNDIYQSRDPLLQHLTDAIQKNLRNEFYNLIVRNYVHINTDDLHHFFLLACYYGHQSMLDDLLFDSFFIDHYPDFDPHYQDDLGLCLSYRHDHIFRWLLYHHKLTLKKSWNLNSHHGFLLKMAASCGDLVTLEYLLFQDGLESKNRPCWKTHSLDALHYACYYGHDHVVQFFLHDDRIHQHYHRLDLNDLNHAVFFQACQAQQWNIVETFLNLSTHPYYSSSVHAIRTTPLYIHFTQKYQTLQKLEKKAKLQDRYAAIVLQSQRFDD